MAAVRAWRLRAVRHGPELGLCVLVFGVYTLVGLLQWRRLVSPSWDLAIFDQAVRAYAHFQAPVAPIKGAGFNLLGDHFHPLLAVLAPLYWIVPSAATLLVAQAGLVALSVFPVARLAVRRLGRVSGLLIGAAYAASWGIQSAVAVQFHEVALALPLLAFGIEALVDRRYRACALWCAPLVLVKEDLGLTVAVIGLVVLLRGARRAGLALIAWGVGWFGLTVLVILPALNPEHAWAYGGQSGIGRLLRTPWLVPVEFVWPGTKALTLLFLLGVTGFVALRSPVVLAVVPTVAWRFLSDNSGYWGRGWHYSVVLMPIVFVALVDGIVLLRADRRRWLRSYAGAAVPVVATVAVVLLGLFPLRQLVEPESYRPSPRAAAAGRVLGLVSDGASVESDIGLMSRLTDRTTVYWIGRPGNPPPDFVLIDDRSGSWGTDPGDVAHYAETLHPGVRYRTVLSEDGYRLARRD